MKIKEQTIKELEQLKHTEILKVCDLILSLQSKKKKDRFKVPGAAAYLRVREALKQCKGSLSEDILLDRADRI